MNYIDTPTAVNGRFTDGNPNQNIKGTQVSSKWLNALQNEICGLILQSGQKLSDTDTVQMLKAIPLIMAGQVEIVHVDEFTLSPTSSWKDLSQTIKINKGDLFVLTFDAMVSTEYSTADALKMHLFNSTAVSLTFPLKGVCVQSRTYINKMTDSNYNGKIGEYTFVSGGNAGSVPGVTKLSINGFIIHKEYAG